MPFLCWRESEMILGGAKEIFFRGVRQMIKKAVGFIRRLTPYNISKGLKYLKHFGLREFLVRLMDRIEPDEVPYGPWYEKHRASAEMLEKQKEHRFRENPRISVVVPLYRTKPEHLKEMIASVRSQTYRNWELCLADASADGDAGKERRAFLAQCIQKDPRIKVQTLAENAGIAQNTNAAIQMAEGDWIGLLDHDDLLAPDALYEIVSRLQDKEKPEFLYTDEDKIVSDTGEHIQPALKPDFNPDLLRSNNYICHFSVFSAGLLKRIGLLDPEYDGAQDYDLILRAVEQAEGIVHIPRILYHWRTHPASTADNPLSKQYAYEAGKRAIEAHLKRCGLSGEVSLKKDFGFYRVRYPVQEEALVSIIIPNKDQKETLQKCLDSIREKTDYPNYEIIVVENNSQTSEIFDYYKEINGRNRVHVVYWDREFNYSAINNHAAALAQGSFLLFLNNDMEVISRDWIRELLGHCQRPGTGVVGARLYYPDDTIQHAGIIIGIGGVACSMFVGMKRGHTGYFHKESLQQDLSAVTAACMMVKRAVFEAVGGFDENLSVAFNDVDFCLRVRTLGQLVVYDPYVELYHDESKTRGQEDTPEKARRFQSEIEQMRTRWEDLLKKGDPYYNPNLSVSKWNYSLRQ